MAALVEQSVHQIDRIVLFLIDDFGIHLRHLHIGMAEQLRGRVEVCSERQHHRGERVAARVEYTRQSKQQRTGID